MLVDLFMDHLTYEKRFSAHTVSAYRSDLGQFARFLESFGIKAVEQATDKAVRNWMMQLMEGGVGPRSVNRKLSALRAFFRFARLVGAVDHEPTALIDPPKTPKRLPEFVEEKGMAKLFDELAWPPGHKGAVDRLAMEVLYQTGMRLSELLQLKVVDVDLHNGAVRVFGKRRKERLIPISDELAKLIQQFLHDWCSGPLGTSAEHLLIDEKGEPLARRSVQRAVRYYLGQVTSQKKRSPHVLRHTFATHMLEHGADLNAVKELLGHANLAATEVYTHNTVEKLRKVHATAHPRGGQ